MKIATRKRGRAMEHIDDIDINIMELFVKLTHENQMLALAAADTILRSAQEEAASDRA